ncbi:hypothetical protein FGI04_11175 [Dickeya ananatis]|nr:hypothetical protein FGI04_11175 [Dickeya zeae]
MLLLIMCQEQHSFLSVLFFFIKISWLVDMYFSIDSAAADAGVTHALFLVVRGLIVSPSKPEFLKKCENSVGECIPEDIGRYNFGMRKILTRTIEQNNFKTAGEKLRDNFCSRGFRSINNIIDSYNEVAFYYGLGIGGHDISHMRTSDCVEIKISSGEEKITPLFQDKAKTIKSGELIYGTEDRVMAWIGSKDVDSDYFKITEKTTDCLFVIIGHEYVSANDLYTVSNKIRRNIVDASYEFHSHEFDVQEFYYNARSS